MFTVPAEILIAPPSRAITTSSVTVTCAAYGTPPPKVTWHYNNAIVSGGVIETRQQEVKGVYVVTSFLQLCQEGAEVIDSGQYSCQVGNDVADTQPIARTFDLCFVGKGCPINSILLSGPWGWRKRHGGGESFIWAMGVEKALSGPWGWRKLYLGHGGGESFSILLSGVEKALVYSYLGWRKL